MVRMHCDGDGESPPQWLGDDVDSDHEHYEKGEDCDEN